MDLLVFAAYFAIMLLVGWRARKGSPDAYWVAERRYGSQAVAASLVATVFGASSTLGIVGLGYTRGLTGAWWALMGGLFLVLFGLLLAPRVRRLAVYTLPDILEDAYGGAVSVAGGLVIALAWCGVVAAQIVAGAYLLAGILAVSFQAALATVAVVFTVYTLWGGQLSVIRTDAWQFGLLVFGIGAALILLASAGARSGGVVSGAPPGALDFPVTEGFGWYDLLVFYPLIVGMPYLVGPDMYSRVLCARDERSARHAAILAALAVIPLSFLVALLGVMIRARFPGLAPDAAFAVAISELAVPGLRGLIGVGLLGAIMSSADTTLVSASTILSLNVVRPLAHLDDRRALRLTRAFVAVVGMLAWGIAAFQQEIIASLLLAYTVFVGGVALPTLASFWRRRLGVTPRAALLAVLAGGATALLAEIRGGAGLRFLAGSGGVDALERALGPEYGSILPVLLSGALLLGGSWIERRVTG